MTHWQYTPYTIPLMITAITALVLMLYMWPRKGAGVAPFIVAMIGLAFWSMMYALAISSTDLSTQVFWTKIEYFGILTIPSAWFIFAAQYTHRDKWLSRRIFPLILIEPILFLLFLWTTESHGLVWSHIDLITQNNVVYLDTAHGAVFWLHTAYSYILFVIASVWLLQDQARSNSIYRSQVIILIIGASAPWLANIITLAGLNPVPVLDLTPFAFTLMSLMTAWALFRFRFLDLSPVAKDLVIASMSDVLMVLDVAARIVDLNPAAEIILGKRAPEAVGMSLAQFLADRPDLLTRYKGVSTVHDEIQLASNGTTRFYDLRISPIRDRQQKFIGQVIILRDIEDRKQAEQALQQTNKVLEERTHQLEIANAAAQEANRLKSDFLSTMSHELRTPFNAMMGFTDLLLTEAVGPLNATQRRFLERLASNNKRLLALINDVLDLSRIEANRMEFRASPYSPRDMLTRASEQTSSLFSQKGLTFEVQLDSALPESVTGDEDRVQQIVVNLLSNAAKFTSTGKVALSAKAIDSEKWQIAVRDTGMGIAPHQLETIFEPFRQIDATNTRQHAGTGLGLAIVRDLCRLMYGTVRVESEVGQGSVFTVVLPIKTSLPELVSSFR